MEDGVLWKRLLGHEIEGKFMKLPKMFDRSKN
jgi:hypothetical protein